MNKLLPSIILYVVFITLILLRATIDAPIHPPGMRWGLLSLANLIIFIIPILVVDRAWVVEHSGLFDNEENHGYRVMAILEVAILLSELFITGLTAKMFYNPSHITYILLGIR